MAQRSPSRRRPSAGWRARVLLLAASVLVALGLCEIAVRLLGWAPPLKPISLEGAATVYQRSSNPILGFELKANYRDPSPNLISSYASTNSQGQRDVERTVSKPPGVTRILVLGDSVVEGEGIAQIEDTLTRRLERLYPDGKTEVLNFGVSGYCTLAEVELLEVKGIAFQPDIVVLVFVENDFDNFNRQLFTLGGGAARPALVNGLILASHLFRALCVKLDFFHLGSEEDSAERNQRAIGENNVVTGLRRLAVLSRRHRIKTLIAIWPKFLNDRIAEGPFMPGSDRELIVERLARMFGLAAERLSPHFERHRAALGPSINPRLRFTVKGDTLHPSEEGCAVAAEALRTILDSRMERWKVSGSSGAGPEGPPDPAAVEAALGTGSRKADTSTLYNNTALALQGEGKIEEAIAFFRKAQEANPKNPRPSLFLGEALRSKGRLEEAIAEYQKAIAAEPDFGPAHYSLALATLERGGKVDREERKEAHAHFQRALELNPELAETHYQLALEAERRGSSSQAAVYQSQVIRVRPEHGGAQCSLGMILRRSGEIEGARKCFAAALAARAEWPEPLRSAAWLLATHPDAAARDPALALALAAKAVEGTARKDAASLDALAAAQAAAGEFDLAVRTAEEALPLATGDLAAAIRARRDLYRSGKPMVSAAEPSPGAGSGR